MKKTLIILLFLSNFALKAQTLKDKIDAIVSPEQVSTGILYNRISPIVDLHLQTQDTTSQEYFKQAYFELFNASYEMDRMLPIERLNDFIYHQSTQNIVSIGALLYDFNYTDALSVEIVMGKNFIAPELLKINQLSAFIPAFLSEKPIYAGISTSFVFPQELFLTNTTTFIKSLEIDFGDKISRKFILGETQNITFESAGTKIISIVAKLSDGTKKLF